MSLADEIIESGPYAADDINPIHRPIGAAEINALRDELIAARQLREALGQVKVSALFTFGPTLNIRHTCPHWAVHADHPMTLAEVLERSAEHREVCGGRPA